MKTSACTVFDGTGAPAVRADVAIAGDRIERVGSLSGTRHAREIDANGRYLQPGFVNTSGTSNGTVSTQRRR